LDVAYDLDHLLQVRFLCPCTGFSQSMPLVYFGQQDTARRPSY